MTIRNNLGSKLKSLLQLADSGPIRAQDLVDHQIPRVYLTRALRRGLLERVARGVYRSVDGPLTELSTLAEVSLQVPHATVCLLSALQFHELTTELPHAVWLMIDRTARRPALRSHSIELVRASGLARSHGTSCQQIEGVPVSVTTPAKTVADCFRYRRQVGLDVAISALSDGLATRAFEMDELLAAARADRVFSVMRPYIEALA